MKTFRGIIAAAGVFGAYYMAGVFVTGEWDTSQWPTTAKAATVLFPIVLACFAYAEAKESA